MFHRLVTTSILFRSRKNFTYFYILETLKYELISLNNHAILLKSKISQIKRLSYKKYCIVT
jgi:hypothetical protein